MSKEDYERNCRIREQSLSTLSLVKKLLSAYREDYIHDLEARNVAHNADLKTFPVFKELLDHVQELEGA